MPEGDLLTDAFVFCNRTLGFVNAPVMMQRAVAKMDDLSIDAEPYRKRRDLMVDILTEAGFEFEMPKGGFSSFRNHRLKTRWRSACMPHRNTNY